MLLFDYLISNIDFNGFILSCFWFEKNHGPLFWICNQSIGGHKFQKTTKFGCNNIFELNWYLYEIISSYTNLAIKDSRVSINVNHFIVYFCWCQKRPGVNFIKVKRQLTPGMLNNYLSSELCTRILVWMLYSVRFGVKTLNIQCSQSV